MWLMGNSALLAVTTASLTIPSPVASASRPQAVNYCVKVKIAGEAQTLALPTTSVSASYGLANRLRSALLANGASNPSIHIQNPATRALCLQERAVDLEATYVLHTADTVSATIEVKDKRTYRQTYSIDVAVRLAEHRPILKQGQNRINVVIGQDLQELAQRLAGQEGLGR